MIIFVLSGKDPNNEFLVENITNVSRNVNIYAIRQQEVWKMFEFHFSFFRYILFLLSL